MVLDEKVALIMVKLSHLAVQKDREAYLRALVELCSQVTESERATVYFVDHARGELWSRVAQRHPMEIRLPLGEGIAGKVAQTGETINVPDAYDDPRFHPEFDQRSGFRTQNTLTVPVWSVDGRNVIAVLQVLNKRGGPFERRDQMLLERVAEKIAPAITQMSVSATSG